MFCVFFAHLLSCSSAEKDKVYRKNLGDIQAPRCETSSSDEEESNTGLDLEVEADCDIDIAPPRDFISFQQPCVDKVSLFHNTVHFECDSPFNATIPTRQKYFRFPPSNMGDTGSEPSLGVRMMPISGDQLHQQYCDSIELFGSDSVIPPRISEDGSRRSSLLDFETSSEL